MTTTGTRDAGFATVWVVLAMTVVVVVATLAASVGVVTLRSHRARAAADAAALAAALTSIEGPAAACARAAAVAARDGATIASCRLDGAVAEVRVVVRLPRPLRRFGVAGAVARAGPATRPDGSISP
jgi:secretion/DNA translocation related TadE-like protein